MPTPTSKFRRHFKVALFDFQVALCHFQVALLCQEQVVSYQLAVRVCVLTRVSAHTIHPPRQVGWRFHKSRAWGSGGVTTADLI